MQPFLILDTPNSPERRGHRAILADHRQHSEQEVQRYCDAVQQGLPQPPHLHVTRKVTQRLHDRDRVDMPEHLILAGISSASVANIEEVEAALQRLLVSWDPTILNSFNDRDDLFESHPTVVTWEAQILGLIVKHSPSEAPATVSRPTTPLPSRSKGLGAGLLRVACILAVAGIVIACVPKLKSLMDGLWSNGETGLDKWTLLKQALQIQLSPERDLEKDILQEMKGRQENVGNIFAIFNGNISAKPPYEPTPAQRENLWDVLLPPKTPQSRVVEWDKLTSMRLYKKAVGVSTDREMCKKLREIVKAICAEGEHGETTEDEKAAIAELKDEKNKLLPYSLNFITLRDLDRWSAVEKFFGPGSKFLDAWSNLEGNNPEDWSNWNRRIQILSNDFIDKREIVKVGTKGAPWRLAILKAVTEPVSSKD